MLGLSPAITYNQFNTTNSASGRQTKGTTFISSLNQKVLGWMAEDQGSIPVEKAILEKVKSGFNWLFGDEEDTNSYSNPLNYSEDYNNQPQQACSFGGNYSYSTGSQGQPYSFPSQVPPSPFPVQAHGNYNGAQMAQQSYQGYTNPNVQLPQSMKNALNLYGNCENVIHPISLQ